MIWIEASATAFGILCVWFYIRQNIWCWPTGLVQVILFMIIFYEVKLYSDLILHFVYIILQIYGWYYWLHGGRPGAQVPVSRLSPKSIALWISVAVIGSAALGFAMSSYTDASVPYPDAFTTATSLVAQWLIARKKLESWLFWITVDVAAIAIYLYKALYFTAGLYFVFLILAIAGYLAWRQSFQLKINENGTYAGKIRASP